MATFVAMFYSQRSRRLLLNASTSWKKKKLFTLLKHVLDDKYLKTASRESEDTFGNILSLLYKENNNAFPYKVLNRATGRCILIKNASKAANATDKVYTKKLPKDCPEGKVRNPATGRCILIKNAKATNANK